VKTDRFGSAFTRAATAIALAGLLLTAGHPVAGQMITFHVGKKDAFKGVSVALARGVGEVLKRFEKNRRMLHSVQGSGGQPAYLREEVASLIARTENDLDQAIAQTGEPRLDGLSAWAAEEIRRIQEELAAQPGHMAVLPFRSSTLYAVAVVASLASASAAAPQQETLPARTSDQLLDQAKAVIERIFVLASRNDLEVDLWVGSTPTPQANFSFWSQGRIRGSTPAPQIIPTNGKKDHVLRGLYNYRAALGEGAVTELIMYPNSAAASTNGPASERLDLVNGTSFFCCRFDQQYCRHVASKKECKL